MFLRKNMKNMKKFKGFSNLHLDHENGKSGQEFISYIADAVKERVEAFLTSSDFMSILLTDHMHEKQGLTKRWLLFVPKEMVGFLFIVVFESNKNGKNNLRYFCSNSS